MPQASNTGAFPGARHGLNLKMSSTEPGSLPWLAVRYRGSSVGQIELSGQWS